MSDTNKMRITVYSLDGKELEKFENVDSNFYTHDGISVSFKNMNETICVTNAIVIARKPCEF